MVDESGPTIVSVMSGTGCFQDELVYFIGDFLTSLLLYEKLKEVSQVKSLVFTGTAVNRSSTP